MTANFEAARMIGNNIGGAFKQAKENSAIESILSQAIDSGDPQVLQHSIGQILSQVSPERQGAAIQYLEGAYKKAQESKKEIAARQAANQAGYTYGAPPGVQTQQVKDVNKQKRLASYGLGGNVASNGQADPNASPLNVPNNLPDGQSSLSSPNIGNQTVPNNPLKNLSKDQLTWLTGAPDREISEPAKAELRALEQQEKLDQKNIQKSREEQLQFHKESQKYDEDLLKQTRIAKNQQETINNIEKAINSGNVKPTSLANIFKGFGQIGDKISEALLNQDESTLISSIPSLLEGWKDVFGVRLTDADLRLLQDKLPSLGKSPEANKAVLKILRKYADMTLLRGQIATQIKKDNEGLRPLDYAAKIEERFDEMTKPVKIIRPDNGKLIEIPAYQLSQALNSGAKLSDE